MDDDLAMHAKVIEAGNAAMGLWVRAGAWCAQHLTDGWIPQSVVRTMGSNAQSARLVGCGLWSKEYRDGTLGYLFHEWELRQPTRREVEQARNDGAARQQRYRDRRSEGTHRNAVTNELRNAVSDTTPARPVPARPDPSPFGRGTEKEGGVASANGHATPTPQNFIDPQKPNCAKHQGIPYPPPCGDCKEVNDRAKNGSNGHSNAAPVASARTCPHGVEIFKEKCQECWDEGERARLRFLETKKGKP